MSLIYGEYLVNVHSSDIPHSFIPHFTLHSAEKIRIKFSANYPLTTLRIPQSAFRKILLPVLRLYAGLCGVRINMAMYTVTLAVMVLFLHW